MQILRVFRTISFKLAALYASLFALSTGAIFGIVYWLTTEALNEQLRRTVQGDTASLAALGPDDISPLLARETADGASPIYYLIQDREGRKLAGNLPGTPPAMGWHTRVVRASQIETERPMRGRRVLLALGTELVDGRILTVAGDTRPIRGAQEAIVQAFAWATAVTLLLALAGGIAISRGFLRRIDDINRTTRAIMNGQLTDRIKVVPTGDEVHELGRNLNEMLDRLQGLIEGLRHVSSNIAHELRTPLTRLKQRLETVQGENTTTQEYADAVTEALREADGALSTFGALLRIAQIESGTRRSRFVYVDLSDVAGVLGETYRAVAEDLGKALSVNLHPGARVRGDRELLIQLFANLIENALWHTQDNAAISLTIRTEARSVIAEVTDNGPGVPEAERAAVFRHFYRLERSRDTGGAGLGLALVAAIIELHGAQITLHDAAPGLLVRVSFQPSAT